MRHLLKIVLLITFFSSCSSNLEKRNTVKLETDTDSIFYNSINDYIRYLSSLRNREFAVIIKNCKSSDTLSYLITCEKNDEISTIIHDSLSSVYKIENHFIFSQSPLFSNFKKIELENVLLKFDRKTYNNYKQKGIDQGLQKVMWDCKFLYLVLIGNKVARKELRFFDTEPVMWKNCF